jgi:hypothetical protein
VPVTANTSDGPVDLHVAGVRITSDRLFKTTVTGIHQAASNFGCPVAYERAQHNLCKMAKNPLSGNPCSKNDKKALDVYNQDYR